MLALCYHPGMEKKRQFNVRLSKEAHQLIFRMAAQLSISQPAMMEIIVREAAEKRGLLKEEMNERRPR